MSVIVKGMKMPKDVGSVSCELAIANSEYTWNNVQSIAHWSRFPLRTDG